MVSATHIEFIILGGIASSSKQAGGCPFDRDDNGRIVIIRELFIGTRRSETVKSV
jgi:hypothetical protein